MPAASWMTWTPFSTGQLGEKIATLVGPAVTQLPIETALKRWRAGRESWIVVVSARKNGPWLVGWCMYICIWIYTVYVMYIYILITYTNRIYQYTYIYDMATQYFQIFWHFWAKTRTMTWIMLSLLVGIKLPQTHKNHRITESTKLYLQIFSCDSGWKGKTPTEEIQFQQENSLCDLCIHLQHHVTQFLGRSSRTRSC